MRADCAFPGFCQTMSKRQPDLNIRSAVLKKGVSCRKEGKAHLLPTFLLPLPRIQGEMAHDLNACPGPQGQRAGTHHIGEPPAPRMNTSQHMDGGVSPVW